MCKKAVAAFILQGLHVHKPDSCLALKSALHATVGWSAGKHEPVEAAVLKAAQAYAKYAMGIYYVTGKDAPEGR